MTGLVITIAFMVCLIYAVLAVALPAAERALAR
jgi:hypothetical protein